MPRFRFVLLLLLLVPPVVRADEAAERGLALAREAERRASGFGDQAASLTMVLFDAEGKVVAERSVRSFTLEGAGDEGDKGLLVFDNPGDVRGTAFLTHAEPRGEDKQWLYLPALKRVKRIGGGDRGASFLGSEFTYEDLSPRYVEEYTYRFLRTEELDGRPCFVLERTPVEPSAVYHHQVVWLDEDLYRPRRIDSLDASGVPHKRLTFTDYAEHGEGHWRAAMWRMVNLDDGRSTELRWSDFRFDNGFTEADFSRNALSRTR